MDKKPAPPSKEFINWLLAFWLAALTEEQASQPPADAHEHHGVDNAHKHRTTAQHMGARETRNTTGAIKARHGSRKP
jgi:hypothetical protein